MAARATVLSVALPRADDRRHGLGGCEPPHTAPRGPKEARAGEEEEEEEEEEGEAQLATATEHSSSHGRALYALRRSARWYEARPAGCLPSGLSFRSSTTPWSRKSVSPPMELHVVAAARWEPVTVPQLVELLVGKEQELYSQRSMLFEFQHRKRSG